MTTITVTDEEIIIQTIFANKELCKAVPGAKWDKARQLWCYPRRASVAYEIHRRFAGVNMDVDVPFCKLVDEHTQANAASAYKDIVPTKMLAEPMSQTKSWEHQKRAFHFSNAQTGIMLAMDMGTGKSKVAVDLCSTKHAMRILIMCPLSVINVWPREFRQHYLGHHFKGVTVVTCETGTNLFRRMRAEQAVKLAAVRSEPVAIVINHESVWRDEFAAFVRRTDWDVIIVDESHRAKQHNGKFGRFLGNLQQAGAFKMCLTGTPMPHSPLDCFSQYRFLDPGIFGTNFHRFKMRYAVLGGYLDKQVVGFDNQDELHEKFYSIGFRVTKAEALDLPDEIYVRRESHMEKDAAAVYQSIRDDFYAKVETGEITASNALVQLLRLQQITSGHVGLDGGGHKWISDHKRMLLEDVMQDLPGPVVVFCRFTPDLAAVRETAKKLKRTYGEISGAHKDLTSDATMPEGIDVLGVQIQSGGVGIDLTRASVAIDYSVGFSLGDYLQSRSRLHRPGQESKVTYIQLVTPGTVDEAVYDALQAREDVIESVLRSNK
jgi:SNF2 family DNA or RNA helicase